MGLSQNGLFPDLTPEGGLDEGDDFQIIIRPRDVNDSPVALTDATIKVVNQNSLKEIKTLADLTLDTSNPQDPFYHLTVNVLPYTTVFVIQTTPKSTAQPYIRARPLFFPRNS